MAFPLSHPAIVLPLTLLPKRWASATGLIIGTLIPDIEYLLRMRMESSHAGTWPGLFYFDLPAGIALSFIFHYFIRDELIKHLPLLLRKRFEVFVSFNWFTHFRKYWPAVIISLLIGGATHILWDELDLTHPYGHVYRSLNAWSSTFASGDAQLVLIRIMQHLPSALGLLLIIFVIWKMPVRETLPKKNIYFYWLFVLLFGTVFMFTRIILFPPDTVYAESILTLSSGCIIGMLVWGLRRKVR